MPIQNKLRLLIAEKALREKRRLNYQDVAQEAGIPKSVVSLYIAQQVRRFDSETLAKLCKYFDCQPGDLLEYYEDEDEMKNRPK